jgi:Spy/CpxP family protein refolding chaperone
MNKSRLWIVLSLILLFAAGMVAGIFADKWFLSKRAEARRGQSTRPPTLEFWSKELGLTVEQQGKIREIFKHNEERLQNDERLKGLRGDLDKRYGEIRAQLRAEIDAVLTPVQKQKLEAMIQKHDEERRRDNERRQRPREPRSDEASNHNKGAK